MFGELVEDVLVQHGGVSGGLACKVLADLPNYLFSLLSCNFVDFCGDLVSHCVYGHLVLECRYKFGGQGAIYVVPYCDLIFIFPQAVY